MLAVKREFEHVTVEVSRTAVFEQSIWILIGSKDKVRIGLIYAPQESRTDKKQIKEMYDRMKGEINTSKVNKEKIIIMGDFNCKIGTKVAGNKEEITKGGKILLKMVEKEQMTILNATDKCKGLWTREQGSTKSILDYFLIKEEDKEYAKEIIIDEEKVITPFRIVKKKGSIKTIYTDHNAMGV
eukprot:Seg3022.3 transcript_id=Seg3022.3/GoldUCD/mRNA.D3Y31 product="hypothetical protein" protein_id=Seg3022.3/GoldUCD/D3Y31